MLHARFQVCQSRVCTSGRRIPRRYNVLFCVIAVTATTLIRPLRRAPARPLVGRASRRRHAGHSEEAQKRTGGPSDLRMGEVCRAEIGQGAGTFHGHHRKVRIRLPLLPFKNLGYHARSRDRPLPAWEREALRRGGALGRHGGRRVPVAQGSHGTETGEVSSWRILAHGRGPPRAGGQ
jgi:hypothetical protein